MHISFLPAQLFYVTLSTPFFLCAAADSVAGFLLRKVELRQFVRDNKNHSVLQYAFLVTVTRRRLFRPPSRPQVAKITLSALYEAGMQPNFALCNPVSLAAL